MTYKRLAASTVLSLGLLLTTVIAELHADFISIENFSVVSSNTSQLGSLDIFYVNEGASPIDLSGFQLKVTLVGGDPGTILTGFDAPKSVPYVFAGASDRPAGLISNGSKTAEVGDFLLSGSKPVPALDRKGLASLQFSIPAKASLGFQLALSLDPQDTFVANGQGQFLPFTFTGGTVSVVPEPTATAMLSLVSLMSFGVRRRSNSRVRLPTKLV